MSRFSNPAAILPSRDGAILSFHKDDDALITADLRVRFALICVAALAAFAALLAVDDIVAGEHVSATGHEMVVADARQAVLVGSLAALAIDDFGAAGERELVGAAADLRTAVTHELPVRSGPLALSDSAKTAALSRELLRWADEIEALTLAEGWADQAAARSRLRATTESDLLARLKAMGAQTQHRVSMLWRIEIALRIGGLIAICGVLMLIWFAVIRPLTHRQSLVLKQLRRNEAAARELAAKVSEADEAKANFLSVISHELRTPMNGILGCAELIRVSADNERQQTLAATICESGSDLMTIVSDILDFTDLKSGELELFDGVVDVEQLVGELKDKFGAVALENRARLEVNLVGDPDRTRAGDMARMMQILDNLTDNAIRFTQGGAVYVTIDNRFARNLALTVRDTGVGMSPPEVARAFAPFSQADAGATRTRGGAGMGLTIVKRLVDAMGGNVRLQSRAGAGTTVTVSVPLPFRETHQVPEPKAKRRAPKVPPETSTLSAA